MGSWLNKTYSLKELKNKQHVNAKSLKTIVNPILSKLNFELAVLYDQILKS
jgi:hypothetical protein